jgi:hypothetical protein
MITNLFYSKDLSEYYWTGKSSCDKCKKSIELKGLLVWDYLLYNFNESIYCFFCKEQILRTLGRYAEIKNVTMAFEELLPDDVMPIKPSRLSVGNSSGSTVFEAAVMKMDGKVKDSTVLVKPLLLSGKKDSLLLDSDETR